MPGIPAPATGRRPHPTPPQVPRPASARSTLLYVLGDLVHPSQTAVPTSAFLAAMSHVGHEAPASRQSIARAKKADWISGTRRGRETWWTLTDNGHRLIDDGQRRITDLGRDRTAWDRRWFIVFTTVPHERRAVRERLYRYLTWSGFGSPTPGVWITPFADREHGARFAIDHFDLQDTTFSFIGSTGSVGLQESEVVARAWDLDNLDAHYDSLLTRYHTCNPRTDEAVTRCLLQLDGDLQRLPLLDPQLPAALAPHSTSNKAALELLALRSRWLGASRNYWATLTSNAPPSTPTAAPWLHRRPEEATTLRT